ncbi:hypothetical protein PV08_01451 [Exophiala spinifera]|uniref:Zn(2)-C6 fungal-type domain-containing protein n=1 Tax=Exophiala spinifera TaxID=91928 RepID=A0A0D2BPK0_9EURO|nr:uncharacterized protein PV08_01451 [Exophiala spinifera]KIW20873.1 hypothetical protein PV08_01451 [Exophiala spinifera]
MSRQEVVDSPILSNSPPAAAPEAPSPTPRRKRSKISLACNNCRYRKTRCDGRLPVCLACERRRVGSTCIFERPPLDLHKQDAESRARLQSSHRRSIIEPDRSPLALADNHHGHSQPETDGEPHVDGVATVTAENDTALYGGSSTINLIRHMANRAQTFDASSEARISKKRNRCPVDTSRAQRSTGYEEIFHERDDSAVVYPARRNADDYLACYWEFIHPVFPIIHKPSLERQYRTMWLPENEKIACQQKSDDSQSIFPSMLNLVFALGCQFSTLVPSRKRSSIADDFYQRSRRLFVFDILDSSSLPAVQLLLLQGVYLQSSRYATRCWNVVGLAVRAAHSLGMHIGGKREGETQLDREMNRRIWHTCVILDR